MIDYPIIPESIVVHLGAPDENAQNVRIPFPDYIKNVASSEIYPTWPREAIIANVLAQISVAMNRVYTEYYRSSGKDFDITSSTAYDQAFIYQRNIYDTISQIVDEVFNSYLKRRDNVEPLFAQFCDGVNVTCPGLSQWGSVELANQGYDALSILRYYFGYDLELVENVSVSGIEGSSPVVPLYPGDTGREIELVQRKLNRISTNYPAIPKIYPTDGFYGNSTEDAVKTFQSVFGLTPDGIIGRATWYRIQFIYNAVKRLSEVSSEGIKFSELSTQFSDNLSLGASSEGVVVLQYYLNYISLFMPTVIAPIIDGVFGEGTRQAVISYQKTYGLEETGIVDRELWESIEDSYRGFLSSINFRFVGGNILPFPGRIIVEGTEGPDVVALQEYLNFISDSYPEIPKITVDGVFGNATRNAVSEFIRIFGIPGTPDRITVLIWNAITQIYDDLYTGGIVSEGQYPGFDIF